MELDLAPQPGGEDGTAQVLASVPLAPGGRLHIAWGAGNELLAAGLPLQQPADGGVAPAGGAATAAAIQWGCPSPAERRVAYETLPKFKQLQLALQQGGANGHGKHDVRAATLDFSRAVSDILATEEPGDDAAAELSQERALWELLEMFFVQQPTPHGTAAEGLARWLARSQAALSPAPLAPQLAEVAAALPAEAADGFWHAAARAAALGWTQEAVGAVCGHSALLRWADEAGRGAAQAEVDVLEPVALLLRRMPRYCRPADARGTAGRDFDDFAEFQHYRAAWQAQCREFLSAPEWDAARAAAPATAAGAYQVLSVLSGVEAALVASTTGWPELLVAQLLHVSPGLRPQVELRALLRRCQSVAAGAGAEEPPPPLNALPTILQAAAEGDAQTVASAASAAGCSPWFMAHSPLLLAASPRGAAAMAAPLQHAGGDQAEAYLLEYVATLAPHRATRRVAAEYLAWCPVHGAAAFAELLPRLEPAAALHLAERQQLPALAAGVRKAAAAGHLQAGRLGAALAELVAAGDTGGAAAAAVAPLVADVAAALAEGPQPALRPVPDIQQLTWLLGAAAAAGGRRAGSREAGSTAGSAAFLLAYSRLADAWAALQAADSQDYREEAAAAAVGALAAAPDALWLPLAAAVAPLLEASPPVLSLADTQQLLLRLQAVDGRRYALEAPLSGLESAPAPEASVAAGQAALVSRALASSFARAHVAEMVAT